jgi:protein KTI12
MLHADAPKEAAAAWNAARPAQQAYSGVIFEDLWGRFEEPDARSRWDRPLYRVASAGDAEARDAALQVRSSNASVFPLALYVD